VTYLCRNCGITEIDTAGDCRRCGKGILYYKEAEASVALDTGDGSTQYLVEIGNREYESLLADRETLRAWDGVRAYAVKHNRKIWCEELNGGKYGIHLFGVNDNDELYAEFSAIEKTSDAAIRALHGKVKEK